MKSLIPALIQQIQYSQWDKLRYNTETSLGSTVRKRRGRTYIFFSLYLSLRPAFFPPCKSLVTEFRVAAHLSNLGD